MRSAPRSSGCSGGFRSRACTGCRRRGRHPLPEPRLVSRLGVPHDDGAASHQLRRQGRVHGLVEDEVPLPGDGDDPDRSLGWSFERRGVERGDRRARPRRPVRHLPRGHALAQRLAAQGPHGGRPAGVGHRLPAVPGRRDRHGRHPAARREGARSCSSRRASASGSRSTRATIRSGTATISSTASSPTSSCTRSGS